jgi:hypothetical protein
MQRKAAQYRRQAKELRNAASATDHKINRQTLLKFAEEYDRMARYPDEKQPKKLIWPWWSKPKNSN